MNLVVDILRNCIDSAKETITCRSDCIHFQKYVGNGEICTILIEKSSQKLVDVPLLRKIIPGLEGRCVLQVVGDSARAFSVLGTTYANKTVAALLADDNNMILWGFTGFPESTSAQKDINQIVNDWIDADPDRRGPRCIASIVDADTFRALTEWGCLCPTQTGSLRNLLVVTGGARFGDDIYISDALTDHLVVFEGGMQSFEQIVECLEMGRRVSVLTNLREEQTLRTFSAAQAMKLLMHSEVDALNQTVINYMETLQEPLKSPERFAGLVSRLAAIFPSVRSNISVI